MTTAFLDPPVSVAEMPAPSDWDTQNEFLRGLLGDAEMTSRFIMDPIGVAAEQGVVLDPDSVRAITEEISLEITGSSDLMELFEGGQPELGDFCPDADRHKAVAAIPLVAFAAGVIVGVLYVAFVISSSSNFLPDEVALLGTGGGDAF